MKKIEREWTQNRDGVSNSSAAFKRAVDVVKCILKHHRLNHPLEMTARHIVAELAHGTTALAPAAAKGRG